MTQKQAGRNSRKKASEDEIQIAPPTRIEAERYIIGSLMAENAMFDLVSASLTADDFSEPLHRQAYAAIAKLINAGLRANYAAIEADLTAKAPDDFSIERYMLRARKCIGSEKELVKYAAAVKDAAECRLIMDACANYTRKAATGEGGVAASLAKDAAAIASGELSSSFQHISAGMDDLRQWLESDAHPGLSTGFSSLDRMIGGLHQNRLIIIGARPKQGKTALLQSMMLNMMRMGTPVTFFSLELKEREVKMRFISLLTGISYEHLANKTFDRARLGEINAALEEIKRWPFHLDTLPKRTTEALAARARNAVKLHGSKAIFIDYLTKLGVARRTSGPYEKVTQVCLDLEEIKNSEGIPLVCAAQLNRDNIKQNRTSSFEKFNPIAFRPIDTDLRDSGQIEQSADTLIFLNRPEFYLKKLRPVGNDSEAELAWESEMEMWRGKAEVEVFFNRHGRDGMIPFVFDGPTMRFSEEARLAPANGPLNTGYNAALAHKELRKVLHK